MKYLKLFELLLDNDNKYIIEEDIFYTYRDSTDLVLIGKLTKRDNYNGYKYECTPAMECRILPEKSMIHNNEIGLLPLSGDDLKKLTKSTPEEIEFFYTVLNAKKYNI